MLHHVYVFYILCQHKNNYLYIHTTLRLCVKIRQNKTSYCNCGKLHVLEKCLVFIDLKQLFLIIIGIIIRFYYLANKSIQLQNNTIEKQNEFAERTVYFRE